MEAVRLDLPERALSPLPGVPEIEQWVSVVIVPFEGPGMKVQFVCVYVCVCRGSVVCTHAVTRKCPQMASLQCAPGTYVKTAPRRQTTPKLTHPNLYTSRLG